MVVPTEKNTLVMYQTLAFTGQMLFARVKFQTELQNDKQDKTTCPESSISGAQRYRELTFRYITKRRMDRRTEFV